MWIEQTPLLFNLVVEQPAYANVSRSRKSHRKSRSGCQNCKLRRVKCDENKPECSKCIMFGVTCSFSAKGRDPVALLSNRHERTAAETNTLSATPFSANELLLDMINDACPSLEYNGVVACRKAFDMQDLRQFRYYQLHTALTLGGNVLGKIYAKLLPPIACRKPYLLHVILAVTNLHERNLANSIGLETRAETYHRSRALCLLKDKVAVSMAEDDYDSVFSSVVMINCLTYASIKQDLTPESSWPMVTSSDDLDWLPIQKSVYTFFQLTNPRRLNSLYRAAPDAYAALARFEVGTQEYLERSTLYTKLADLCEDTYSSVATTQQISAEEYRFCLDLLEPLLFTQANPENFLWYMPFIARVSPSFIQALRSRDERALLMLTYWYALVLGCQHWWLVRRAKLECASICMYLNRTSQNEQIRDLLQFPADACGHSLEDDPCTPSSASSSKPSEWFIDPRFSVICGTTPWTPAGSMTNRGVQVCLARESSPWSSEVL